MDRPFCHTLAYGHSGTGKSTFASTFPKPLLVFCFDGHGKEMPYRKPHPFNPNEAIQDGPLQQWELNVGTHVASLGFRDVQREDGLIRIEYYLDDNLETPDAMQKFRYRLSNFQQEYAVWKTVVLETVTSMEIAARKQEEKVLNPSAKDRRQWFGGSTDTLEEILIWRFAAFPMNVVLNTHISQDKNEISGEILQGPAGRGRLSKAGLLACYYQEQYRLYTVRDDNTGQRVHLTQTQNRDGWVACTQIDAPDPVWPHYDYLWSNFKQ